jgi:hypothetical protein
LILYSNPELTTTYNGGNTWNFVTKSGTNWAAYINTNGEIIDYTLCSSVQAPTNTPTPTPTPTTGPTYYYHLLHACNDTGDIITGRSTQGIFDTGIFTLYYANGIYKCYTIYSFDGGDPEAYQYDLDLLTEVTSCSDATCNQPLPPTATPEPTPECWQGNSGTIYNSSQDCNNAGDGPCNQVDCNNIPQP